MRKLGDETAKRAEAAGDKAERPVDPPPEKPLQKLIQKMVGGNISTGTAGGDGTGDKGTVSPGRDPNPPKDKKH